MYRINSWYHEFLLQKELKDTIIRGIRLRRVAGKNYQYKYLYQEDGNAIR